MALAKWIPEVKKQSDILVLLSQLPTSELEALAEKHPEISIVVGADPTLTLAQPLWIAGNTLVLDPNVKGYGLGELILDFQFPFKGFYSPAVVAENQRRLTHYEDVISRSSAKEKEMAMRFRSRLLTQDSLENIEGGTVYENRVLELSQEKYGTENVVTVLYEKYKEEIRRDALAE